MLETDEADEVETIILDVVLDIDVLDNEIIEVDDVVHIDDIMLDDDDDELELLDELQIVIGVADLKDDEMVDTERHQ
jgi:hypothetical protein